MSNAPASARKDTAAKQVSLDFVKKQIVHDLFLKFNGARPALQERLEKVWEARYGCSMIEAFIIPPVFTEVPGHGKTTIHAEACEEFASLMSMKFVKEPDQKYLESGEVDENTFVFSVIALAGADQLPDWKLAAAMMGGYGYIFFDDITTAPLQEQHVYLDLASSRLRLKNGQAVSGMGGGELREDASSVHIGLAGNPSDGNKISPRSLNLTNRVQLFYV